MTVSCHFFTLSILRDLFMEQNLVDRDCSIRSFLMLFTSTRLLYFACLAELSGGHVLLTKNCNTHIKCSQLNLRSGSQTPFAFEQEGRRFSRSAYKTDK